MRRVVGDGFEGRRLLIGSIALLALLIADVVLIVLAMGAHVAPRSPTVPEASTAPAQPPASAPAASPSQTAAEASPAVAATRLLAAIDGTRAWRATIGTCEEPGVFEVTSDGGQTWEQAGLGVAGPVLALEPTSDGRRGIAVVGDEQCVPVAHRTFTAAIGWEPHPEQRVGSYITVDGRLILEGVQTAAPCETPSAGTGAGGGVVLCGGEALARNGVGDWLPIAQGVAAIGPASEGVALALADGVDCDGLAVGVVVGGALQSTCAGAAIGADVAVSAVGDQIWLWADEAVEILSV